MYALKYANKTYSMDKFRQEGTNKSYVSFKVSGEDFDVSKVEEDDAYLFTVAGGEVQTCVPAETVKDTEITSFKKGSNVTAAGTKYEFSNAAYYEHHCSERVTDGTVTNLKDATGIYLDAYGNLIGLEEVDAVDNYVFIAGADTNSSNLATKTTDANATSSWTAPPRSSRSARPRATVLPCPTAPFSTSGLPTPWTRTASTP
ncbi:MAG: hypothetical protein ACLUS6_07330 [Dysosmobacter sp.]